MIKILLHGLATAATLLGVTFAFAAGGPTAPVVIGHIDPQTGRAELEEQLLQRNFADGGTIEHFVAMPFDDGYNLLRIGKDAQGNCRTEALRLSRINSQLLFKPVVWYTTCSSSTCDANNDGNFAMCSPNHDKSACDCNGANGVSNCNFGINVEGMGYKTVIVL